MSGNRYLDAYDLGFQVERLRNDNFIVIDLKTGKSEVVADWDEVEINIKLRLAGLPTQIVSVIARENEPNANGEIYTLEALQHLVTASEHQDKKKKLKLVKENGLHQVIVTLPVSQEFFEAKTQPMGISIGIAGG